MGDQYVEKHTQERRRKHATMRMMGMKPAKVKRKLAKEYDVTEKHIENEWSQRSEWLPKVFDYADVEGAVEQLVSEKVMIKRELWSQFREAESPEVKRRIMSQIDGMTDSVMEILQDLGRAKHERSNVQVDISTVSEESAEVIENVLDDIATEDQEEAEGETSEG